MLLSSWMNTIEWRLFTMIKATYITTPFVAFTDDQRSVGDAAW